MPATDRTLRPVANPYIPGERTKMVYSSYSPYQMAMWRAMEDVCYAQLGGYTQSRMPTPGKGFDMEAFTKWKAKVVAAWASEAKRDSRTRGINAEEMSDSLWLYWYERMVSAAPLKEIIIYD